MQTSPHVSPEARKGNPSSITDNLFGYSIARKLGDFDSNGIFIITSRVADSTVVRAVFV